MKTLGPNAVIIANGPKAPAEAAWPPLGKAGTLTRLALIGSHLWRPRERSHMLAWFTSNALTPARFTDAFEDVDGVHPGFRRNHAKGVGVSGFFESNGNGVRLSKAAVFAPGRVPVIGRFSLGGGRPDAADTPDAVRGLGLQFSLANGELWRTAMIHLPDREGWNVEADGAMEYSAARGCTYGVEVHQRRSMARSPTTPAALADLSPTCTLRSSLSLSLYEEESSHGSGI